MTDTHIEGLRALVGVLRITRDPWCIITGAATALYTGDWSDVQDIDVVVSVGDARRLLSAGFVDRTDGGRDRYRSAIYATREGSVPIDIFADFEINTAGGWLPILPMPMPLNSPVGTVYVPSVQEQLAITRILGRAKDAARIDRLERLIESSP
ncbi:hypothetical protein [Devosia nitrariae]|uniref:Nucleotidyltransferase family protein n=1 Tax=Devosia nitrariae TaxID=2071872 RepID=A0ABQ5W0N5_9HYPH|nr:hypothetical protein [Devosia nitrariae]GLQ53634.1 hypothetical protein GCM10010862_08930 [Devosia nitrariae]